MRNKSGPQTPANASEGPAILQPTKHSCTGLDREGLTPSARRAISNSPSQRRSGSQAHGAHPAHWPTTQCRQSELYTPCRACKNRSTSPAGPYPHSEAPARRPLEGPPGSGPSVPPVPTMATHTVGPASRGIMYKQNVLAQDLHHLGCLLSSPRRQPVLTTAPPRPVHKRRAQATSCRSSVPAISLLIQGALRAREGEHRF